MQRYLHWFRFASLTKSTHCRTDGSHLTLPAQNKNRPTRSVCVLVGVGGFPRHTACGAFLTISFRFAYKIYSLSNRWFSSHPSGTKQKPTYSVGLCFGGSGWIRTTSGLSQQIYSLPRLSNSGARPIPWCGQRESNPHFKLGRLAY